MYRERIQLEYEYIYVHTLEDNETLHLQKTVKNTT